MDLFTAPTANLLPHDGDVRYHGCILPAAAADSYLQQMMQQIPWQHDEVIIFGKRMVTKRKVAWYGSKPYSYTYSNITKQALPFTTQLQALKTLAEKHTGAQYNACLLNLYHNGSEGMTWHSDDEKMLARDASIASISLGAVRKFGFKHKSTGQTIYLLLQHGSLLEMKGPTQRHWLHRLPPTTKVTTPRVNLTFRLMEEG